MTADEPLFADEPAPACCRACRRPISSADARRTGYGGHCRRKVRARPGPAPPRRGGPFAVDQDPLPWPDADPS